MAQNVTIAGNQYPSVPSILIPKTGGGGNATFTDTSPTTASASDVAQGKIFFDSTGSQQTGTASGGSAVIQSLSVTQNGTYTAPTGVDGYSPVTVNVSGGGGASNIVTGTFKGTTTGEAIDVTLNYSGSGYPIVIVIYPKDGTYNPNSTYYSLIERYAINFSVAVKNVITTIPTYQSTGDENKYSISVRYKSSTSSPTTYTNNTSGIDAVLCSGSDASNSVSNVIKFKNATKMSVYIKNPAANYGFAANIEYTYHVIYSS